MKTSMTLAGLATLCPLCGLDQVVTCFHPQQVTPFKAVAIDQLTNATAGVFQGLTYALTQKPAAEAAHTMYVYGQSIRRQVHRLLYYKQLPEGQAEWQLLYAQGLVICEDLLADIKTAWPQLYEAGLARTTAVKQRITWNWDMRETGSLLMTLKDMDAYKGSAKNAMEAICSISEFALSASPSAEYMLSHHNKLSAGSTLCLNRFFEHGYHHTNLKLKQFGKA
jgi:hypothetical protein